MMNDYFCYVYYDENWNAYYVGKGSRRREREAHSVPMPHHIQIFSFDKEWLAYECEIELIKFWGRQLDGGVLMNVAFGGPGCPGVVPNEETRKRLSDARKALPQSKEIVEKMLQVRRRPISLTHTVTGEVRVFNSGREASDELHISQAGISHLRTGTRKTMYQWRLTNE